MILFINAEQIKAISDIIVDRNLDAVDIKNFRGVIFSLIDNINMSAFQKQRWASLSNAIPKYKNAERVCLAIKDFFYICGYNASYEFDEKLHCYNIKITW